ncbi:MAG: TrmH family RNA methyltransferase [Fusicatenibacter sp.]|nr:RNA methyltransferase [Fusicatenibacter sp.]
MITSTGNSQVKHIMLLNRKAKERRAQGLFVAEGEKMYREAPQSWIRKVYLSESFQKMNETLRDGIEYETVEDRVFASMCDTKTPQGVLTLLRMPFYEPEQVLGGPCPLLMVLEDLQDPGNVGTIIRTAEGAGVTGVILSQNSADLFNPKTIRSTMGSIYRMPFLVTSNPVGFVQELKRQGIAVYAAHLNGKNSYRKEDYTGPTAFLIGNEGNGLSEAMAKEASRLIRIPMEGRVESLNAAVASAILMYEAHSQRTIAVQTARRPLPSEQ